MKKNFLMCAALILSTYYIQAAPHAHTKESKHTKEIRKENKKALKQLEGSSVGAASKSNFFEEFGSVADVQWTRQAFFDVSTFTKDGQQIKAYFGADGKMVGTMAHKNLNDLPQNAKKAIDKKYAGYELGDVVLYTDAEDQDSNIILFGTEMESTSNYYVELKKDNKRIVLQVTPEGNVTYFKQLKS